jgi:eukaryotic-like serine/threonine-protein kinase
MSELTSQELLHLYQQGTNQAASEIFDRYVTQLIALARQRIGPKLRVRVDPEDVVQSAYRSFFVHARDNDYVLERAGDLWRLLASITIHKLYRQVEQHTADRRDMTREVGQSNSVAHVEAAAPDPTPDEAAAINEQLQLFIEQLPPLSRLILTARLQGKTIDEIGGEVHKSQRTVRRLLEQVRNQLEAMADVK